jgi:hypothetical protein
MNRQVRTGVAVVVLLVVILFCLGMAAPGDALVSLTVGWVFYLTRVLPQVQVSWPGVLTAAACLAGLAFGLHRLVGSFFPPWPARRTAVLLTLVVLMFIAGISGVGIAHQTAWLASSPEPLLARGSIRHMAARSQLQNNLKQLALAMHNYAGDHGDRLPPAAVYSKDGRPLLSWRVLLLPYIECETLYREFHLADPWDSPHNVRLLPRMPKTYYPPAGPIDGQPTRTHLQVFVGKGTAFEGTDGVDLQKGIPDGTSNTILVVEAAQAVPWTKPQDLPYDPDRPLPLLGVLSPESFNIGMADGSARTLNSKLSERTLRNAITRNDGQVLGTDW